jgi:hypothetical protein
MHLKEKSLVEHGAPSSTESPRLALYGVDLIQVISTLASSQGTSIGNPEAQIGFIPTETALPCLVNTPRPYFFD